MLCKICNTRKPRRYCPGVIGEICTLCCGTEREVTVSCPLDCPHLREARRHDQPVKLDHDQVPNRDVEVSEAFLRQNTAFQIFLGLAIQRSIRENAALVDRDLREAIAALIESYRTMSRGIVYEARPVNPYAAGVYDKVQQVIAGMRKAAQERDVSFSDNYIVKVLVFFHRIGLMSDNGRPKCRWFIDFFLTSFTDELTEPAQQQGPLLIQP